MKSIESIVFQPSRVDRQNRLKSSRFVRLDRFQGLVGCWRGYLSGARCRLIQLMPLSLTVSCFSKIQIGFTFLESAHPGSPGQRAVKWMCVFVCVCVCVCVWLCACEYSPIRGAQTHFRLVYAQSAHVCACFVSSRKRSWIIYTGWLSRHNLKGKLKFTIAS